MMSSSTRSNGSSPSLSSASRPFCGPHTRVPQQLELLLEHVEIERLVVDDQDMCRLHRPPSARAGAAPARPDPTSIEPMAQLREQQVLVDRLGHEVVAPAALRLLLVAAHGMRGEGDHRDGRASPRRP